MGKSGWFAVEIFPFLSRQPIDPGRGHPLIHRSIAHLEVGDCLGGLQFTHLAGYQGALSAFNALQGVQLRAPQPVQVPGWGNVGKWKPKW